jgi:hypothetical protein
MNPHPYDNAPPALMSMSMPMSSSYENNPHDEYEHLDEPLPPPPPQFDLEQVVNEIPYYDLPAGLMCLLIKVRRSETKARNDADVCLLE